MNNVPGAGSFVEVVKNRGFLNLWVNQILVQLSYNVLNFALLIWVYKITDSSFAISLLLFAVYLPTILFGLFSGVLVDVIDRKKIIIGIDLLMALLFITLIFSKESYITILIISFLVNTLAQFYAPAEAATIPLIVKKDQLMTANSMFSSTFYICFLLGFGLSGPLIENLGIDSIFGIGGLLLATAFVLALLFPSMKSKLDSQGIKLIEAVKSKRLKIVTAVGLNEIKQTFKFVRKKVLLQATILILAGVQSIVAIMGVLMPSFFEKVINIQATNSSYILILPLGLGMVMGGILMGRFGRNFSKRAIIIRATLSSGLLLSVVGLAPILAPVVRYFKKPQPLHFTTQLHLSAILTAGSFIAGMMVVSIIITAQTALQESTPEEDRGKIFALLGVVMAVLSLGPVLLAGILSDLFGPQPILLGLGIIIIIGAVFALKPNLFFAEKHLSLKLRQFLGKKHWHKSI